MIWAGDNPKVCILTIHAMKLSLPPPLGDLTHWTRTSNVWGCMALQFMSTTCGLYHTQNQFMRWFVGDEVISLFMNYEVIKPLPRYEYIVHGVVIIVPKITCWIHCMSSNGNGPFGGYRMYSCKFIIKFASTSVKATRSN